MASLVRASWRGGLFNFAEEFLKWQLPAQADQSCSFFGVNYDCERTIPELFHRD